MGTLVNSDTSPMVSQSFLMIMGMAVSWDP
jgi:hypothetical protein